MIHSIPLKTLCICDNGFTNIFGKVFGFNFALELFWVLDDTLLIIASALFSLDHPNRIRFSILVVFFSESQVGVPDELALDILLKTIFKMSQSK